MEHKYDLSFTSPMYVFVLDVSYCNKSLENSLSRLVPFPPRTIIYFTLPLDIFSYKRALAAGILLVNHNPHHGPHDPAETLEAGGDLAAEIQKWPGKLILAAELALAVL